MKILTSAFVVAGVLAVAPTGIASGGPQLLDPQNNPQTTSQTFRFRPTDRQAQVLLSRIRANADALERALDPVVAPGARVNAARRNQDLLNLVADLQQAATHVTDHFTQRRVTQVDVEDLLRTGVQLNTAIPQRQLSPAATNAWTRLRRDLDDLATGYGMTWDWTNPQYARYDAPGGVYSRLTGTYRLDPARSDDPRRVADQALWSLPAAERTRVNRQMANRLNPPDVIAIDRQGGQVTMASSRQPQMSFEVDGRDRTEQAFGRSITTRAMFRGDQLEVSTSGASGQDFSVTFEPLNDGQSLQVTRRLYDPSLRQPVVVRSTYRREANAANWNIYDGDASAYGGRLLATPRTLVPDGRVLVATLDRPLNLRNAPADSRVTLTVRDGARSGFDGATIEAYVADNGETGAANRSGLELDFDQIRLRDGRTAAFAGTIDRVRDASGRTISVENLPERVETRDESDEAIQRGAIGAGIGALIGAIAGGGKGAAIGAAVGAAGGAGSVFIDNTSHNTLDSGTEFTIRARAR